MPPRPAGWFIGCRYKRKIGKIEADESELGGRIDWEREDWWDGGRGEWDLGRPSWVIS